MKLHEDVNAFRVLMNDIHDRTGYRLDVLEKDYYVVLMLNELAKMQKEGLPAYFKGGTALYKALHTTNRFSEDIDLSVDTRDCSRTQNDKRLEKAAKRYTSLERSAGDGVTNRSEVISVYSYKPITDYDKNDALQRFGKLKIEATSFTISEPVTSMEVAAMIYELATEEQKHILEDIYEVRPFMVQTITLERIFVDKLFATEAYVRKAEVKGRAFEAAKHIYDLAVMSKLPQIRELLDNDEPLGRLLNIRMKEELGRLDGVPGVAPKEFTFFNDIQDNKLVISAYETMQRQYVLRECDRISYDDTLEALDGIKQSLKENVAWNIAVVPTSDVTELHKNSQSEMEVLSAEIINRILAGKKKTSQEDYRILINSVQNMCGKPLLAITEEDAGQLLDNLNRYHNLTGQAGKPLTVSSELSYRRTLHAAGTAVNKVLESDSVLKEQFIKLTNRQCFQVFDNFLDSDLLRKSEEEKFLKRQEARNKLLELREPAVAMFVDAMNFINSKITTVEVEKNYWKNKCIFSMIAVMGMGSVEIARLKHQDFFTAPDENGKTAVYVQIPNTAKTSQRERIQELPASVLLLLCRYLLCLGRLHMKQKYKEGNYSEVHVSMDELVFCSGTGEPHTGHRINALLTEWKKNRPEYKELTPLVYTRMHRILDEEENPFMNIILPAHILKEQQSMYNFLVKQKAVADKRREYVIKGDDVFDEMMIEVVKRDDTMGERLLYYSRMVSETYRRLVNNHMTEAKGDISLFIDRQKLVQIFQMLHDVYFDCQR